MTEPDDKLLKTSIEITKPVREEYRKEKTHHPKATTSAFNISSSKKVCKFCQSSHKETDCIIYKTLSLRSGRAKELNLCYNCLSEKQGVRNCTSYYTCKNCKGWHHFSICFKSKEKDQSNDIKSNCEDKPPIVVSAIKQTGSKEKSVALPTAVLPIKTEDGTKNVRALFDQG